MPSDSERHADPRDPEEGIPVGIAFGQALVNFRTGPCSLEHCPIGAGEIYQTGKCMIDGCPRRVLSSFTD